MKKFILIRGHQGSGKTTFAEQQIKTFQKKHPHAEIVHLENDKEMTIDGVYQFSPESFDRAQKKVAEKLKSAYESKNPEILIVNSNTNQKTKSCLNLIKEAKKKGFTVEIYRLHYFYPNLHNVPKHEVIKAYLKLEENKLRDEIHIGKEEKIPEEYQILIDASKETNLFYDTERATYLSENYLLGKRANYREKFSAKYPELRVLKYQNHVFYDNKFDEALLEMRGIILDKFNQIIVRPFNKCFNYSERIDPRSAFPLKIADNQLLDVVVKVNGFLGCCTFVDLNETHPSFGASFNQKVLYSTTGTLDSDFAKLVEKHCASQEALFKAYPNHTFMFEVNDESDPHIIQEELGITLIGIRKVKTGESFSEKQLNEIGKKWNIKRPEIIEKITFKDLKALLATVKHEGFMVFDHHSQELLCKMKSPYYLVSKLFARTPNIEKKLDKRYFDEEYYPLIEYLEEHLDYFKTLNQQEKIKYIQDFIHDHLFHL